MLSALPCANASFDLICTLDILEHLADDDGALAELARVAAPGASVLLKVFMPLGLRCPKALQWRDGMGETQGVDQLLLRCRYHQPSPSH